MAFGEDVCYTQCFSLDLYAIRIYSYWLCNSKSINIGFVRLYEKLLGAYVFRFFIGVAWCRLRAIPMKNRNFVVSQIFTIFAKKGDKTIRKWRKKIIRRRLANNSSRKKSTKAIPSVTRRPVPCASTVLDGNCNLIYQRTVASLHASTSTIWRCRPSRVPMYKLWKEKTSEESFTISPLNSIISENATSNLETYQSITVLYSPWKGGTIIGKGDCELLSKWICEDDKIRLFAQISDKIWKISTESLGGSEIFVYLCPMLFTCLLLRCAGLPIRELPINI